MDALTYELAKTAEGQVFRVVMVGELEYPLTLLTVTELHPWPGQTRRPFTLTFKGAPGQFCPQQIYTFRNDTIGEHRIFIVPIAREREGYAYEAVFN
jgi:hypothetical protein